MSSPPNFCFVFCSACMLPCLCLCLYQVLVLLSRFCFVPSVVSVSETKDLISDLFFGFVSHSGHYFVRCIYSFSTRTSATFAVFLSHLISLSLSFFCVSFSFRLTKKICFELQYLFIVFHFVLCVYLCSNRNETEQLTPTGTFGVSFM